MLEDVGKTDDQATTVLAAGCFWGVEERLIGLKGVVATRVGYCGGHQAAPTYTQVCSGGTGHAEAVKVNFKEDEISFEQLLEHFWDLHDPTQLNRQGYDVGTQYRSAIFYTNPGQRESALKAKELAQKRFSGRVVTQIEAAGTFWDAEEYHQRYIAKKRSKGL